MGYSVRDNSRDKVPTLFSSYLYNSLNGSSVSIIQRLTEVSDTRIGDELWVPYEIISEYSVSWKETMTF